MVETESRYQDRYQDDPQGRHETRGSRLPIFLPAMTRCECVGLSFEELARRMSAERWTAEDAVERTGCGGICTACLPDLKRYLTRLDQTAA